MIDKLLRYEDLVERGIVSNRTTLYRWIRENGFPVGMLIGANTRRWRERDIEGWLNGCAATPPGDDRAT